VELRYALGGIDRAILEMPLQSVIVQLRDALGGRDRASLEMHLEAEIKLISEIHFEAVIERVWSCI